MTQRGCNAWAGRSDAGEREGEKALRAALCRNQKGHKSRIEDLNRDVQDAQDKAFLQALSCSSCASMSKILALGIASK